MKRKTIMLLTVIVSCAAAFGQKVDANKVPADVVSAFKNKFPNAKNAKWEKENSAEYEVEFELTDIDYSATFDSSAKWLETEMDMKFKDLPAAIKSYLATHFSGFKIKECEKVETSGSKSLFEIELKKGKELIIAVFDSSGNFVSREVEK